MARPIVVTSNLTIPPNELMFSFARSAGPGGQNVNKVNSKAVLHWNVRQSQCLPDDVKHRFLIRYARRMNHQGELVLSSQTHREQARNVAECGQKLRDLVLAVLTPPRSRKKTRPTRASVERRLQQKRHQGQRKQNRRYRSDEQ